jgi:hypothetical protein
VYGNTASPSGYAGYFQGDAKVTGDLTVDGALDVPVPFSLSGSVVDNGIMQCSNSCTVGGYGVYGEATITTGTATFAGGCFVANSESFGMGVIGYGGTAGGDFMDVSSSAWGDVGRGSYKIMGSGSVSFVQNHPDRSDRVIVYAAPEGDEVATYTRGTARLIDGEARVPLGETFKWVTNPEVGLTAHLTPRGDWAELYVKSLTTETMVVASHDGSGDVAFDYIIYGLRIGFEEVTIVQEKEREAYIPSMEDHWEAYSRHPGLRRYNALERFKRMHAETYGASPIGQGTARALRDAIEEYDAAIHGPVSEIIEPPLGR